MARARRYGRILTGIDFSAPSRVALKEAAALAGQLGAKLDVLHVAPQLVPTLPMVAASRALVAREQKAQVDSASKRLARWVAGLGGLALETHVLVGEPRLQPHDSILDHARRVRADLIVLGNRGQNVTERLLLGSTADRVLRLSPIPVLLVPGRASRVSRPRRR